MNRLILQKISVIFVLAGFLPSTSPGLFYWVSQVYFPSHETTTAARATMQHYCACEAGGHDCTCGDQCCSLAGQDTTGTGACIQERPERARQQPVDSFSFTSYNRYFLSVFLRLGLPRNKMALFATVRCGLPESWVSPPDPPPPRSALL